MNASTKIAVLSMSFAAPIPSVTRAAEVPRQSTSATTNSVVLPELSGTRSTIWEDGVGNGQELLLSEGSIDWTTQPTRLVFRPPGRPEIREVLQVRDHSEALGRILADLQSRPAAVCVTSGTSMRSGIARFMEAAGLLVLSGLQRRFSGAYVG